MSDPIISIAESKEPWIALTILLIFYIIKIQNEKLGAICERLDGMSQDQAVHKVETQHADKNLQSLVKAVVVMTKEIRAWRELEARRLGFSEGWSCALHEDEDLDALLDGIEKGG